MTGPGPSFLERPDGERVAYVRLRGRAPGVVFLGGFMSDMTGTKAVFLEDLCRREGRAFVRFDYLGHGASSGRFEDGTIGRWAEDAVAVLDSLAEGPQVLVGSSMGGWIALLAALARPDRVAALVGIAAAPDFTRRMWAEEFGDAERAAVEREGRVVVPSAYSEEGYVITRGLVSEAERHMLLDGPVAVACPVRLLHGQRDEAVPWGTSLRLAAALEGGDVEVVLAKDGDHRLSGPRDLARLQAALAPLLSGPGPASSSASVAASPER